MILAHLCDESKGLKTGMCMSLLYLPFAIANALTASLNDGTPLVDELLVLFLYCLFTVGLYMHFATSVIHEITNALGICCFSDGEKKNCGRLLCMNGCKFHFLTSRRYGSNELLRSSGRLLNSWRFLQEADPPQRKRQDPPQANRNYKTRRYKTPYLKPGVLKKSLVAQPSVL